MNASIPVFREAYLHDERKMIQDHKMDKVKRESLKLWLMRRYLLALSCIAGFIIVSQIMLHTHLDSQKHIATVVNISGRQRMLSERIVKLVHWSLNSKSSEQKDRYIQELKDSLPMFKKAHEGLLYRKEQDHLSGHNSKAIALLFERLQPYYEQLLQNAACVAATSVQPCPTGPIDRAAVIDQSQRSFVSVMNDIVFQYSLEGDSATEFTVMLEYILAALALLLLVLEYLFIFKPTVSLIDAQISDIEQSLVRAETAEQNARQLSQYKTEFMSNMSHELRSPMASILGFADEILDTEEAHSESRQAAEYIKRSGSLLLNILNDVLDISKIESGNLLVEKERVCLFSLLADIDVMFKQRAQDKGISFVMSFDYPVPAYLFTDGLRVTQILVNLLSNALKFTDNGEMRLTVSFDRDTEMLSFAVRDTGIGISVDDQSRIFDSFVQVDTSVTRNFGGAGLGLAISRTLASYLDGDLLLESDEGKGSLFTFVHPCTEVAIQSLVEEYPADLQEVRQTTTIEAIPQFRGRVLLVEDAKLIQLYTMRLLQRAGLEATLAVNGEEAVKLAREQDYDLVLMDMHMPIMDGFTATKQLIESGYDVPIVALTASATREETAKCFAAGCTDFLAKPFQRKDFFALLARYIGVATVR